jgi:hypothetical protein
MASRLASPSPLMIESRMQYASAKQVWKGLSGVGCPIPWPGPAKLTISTFAHSGLGEMLTLMLPYTWVFAAAWTPVLWMGAGLEFDPTEVAARGACLAGGDA